MLRSVKRIVTDMMPRNRFAKHVSIVLGGTALAQILGVGGAPRPEEPESFASTILGLVCDRERAFQLGVNGQKAFADYYSWESELPNLLKFYDHILAD